MSISILSLRQLHDSTITNGQHQAHDETLGVESSWLGNRDML
jgi:hypothetical protein